MKVFDLITKLYIGAMMSGVAYGVIFITYKIVTNSVGSF